MKCAELVSHKRVDEQVSKAAAERALRTVEIRSPVDELPRQKGAQWQTLLLSVGRQEML